MRNIAGAIRLWQNHFGLYPGGHHSPLHTGEVEGEVLLFGQEMRTLSLAAIVQQVGVLFQDPDAQLFFPTVEDEVAFGPENLCLPRDEIVLRIDRPLRLYR